MAASGMAYQAAPPLLPYLNGYKQRDFSWALGTHTSLHLLDKTLTTARKIICKVSPEGQKRSQEMKTKTALWRKGQMANKTLAWITLASFLIFSWSCYSWQMKSPQSISPEKREVTKISAIKTRSGEMIDFEKDSGARISEHSIVGERSIRNLVIEKSKIEKPKNLPAPPFDLTTSDGKSYRVTSLADKREWIIILQAYAPISMPLSEIDLVRIKVLNIPLTVLASIGIPLAVIFGVFGILTKGEFTLQSGDAY